MAWESENTSNQNPNGTAVPMDPDSTMLPYKNGRTGQTREDKHEDKHGTIGTNTGPSKIS